MLRRFLALALLAALVRPAAAQSSVFGIRGLGNPGRALSPRAWATGGSLGLVDAESGLNPATLGDLQTLTAVYLIAPQWRSVSLPAGSSSLRDTQFPYFMVASGFRDSPVALGVGFSNYASRNFRAIVTGTEDIRGVPVEVRDTLFSTGGIADLRGAGSYRVNDKLTLGVGLHVLTGENRMTQSRVFSDTAYLGYRQRAELSFHGWGLSAGATLRPSSRLTVGLLLRKDTKASVKQDSLGSYDVGLPLTLGVGASLRVSRTLVTSAQVIRRGWSSADRDLRAQGGDGAHNTLEASGGLEWTPNPQRPWARPLRVGFRYGRLPFLVGVTQPREYGISLGTGFRFAAQRGGVDLALERVWRSAGSQFSERALQLIIGISVRPSLTSAF